MNELVRCSLEISFSKVQAALATKSGGSAEAARSIHKLHATMGGVLECVEGILRKEQHFSAACESAGAHDRYAVGAAVKAETALLCTYAEARSEEEGSDLSDARLLSMDGLVGQSLSVRKCGRTKRKGALGKIERVFARAKDAVASCFTPAVVEEPSSDLQKMEAHLSECKQLLRGIKLWLIHWQAVDAAYESGEGGGDRDLGGSHGAGGAGVGLSYGDEPGSPSAGTGGALSTIATLLRKCDGYSVDVVSRLLEENAGLARELERRHAEKEGLLRAIDGMNLKLLSSENKACQVAMEMLLMAH